MCVSVRETGLIRFKKGLLESPGEYGIEPSISINHGVSYTQNSEYILKKYDSPSWYLQNNDLPLKLNPKLSWNQIWNGNRLNKNKIIMLCGKQRTITKYWMKTHRHAACLYFINLLCLGAIHKLHHTNFMIFLTPPPPCHRWPCFWDPPHLVWRHVFCNFTPRNY